MPNIYDIETLSREEFDLSKDQVLMLDSSDQTMSSAGTTKANPIPTIQSNTVINEGILNQSNSVIFSKDSFFEKTGALQVFNVSGSGFDFTDDGGYIKNTFSPFFTESESSRINNNLSSSGLSFVRFSGENFVFERAINPFHYQSRNRKSYLKFSNLSSLQANLINLHYLQDADVTSFVYNLPGTNLPPSDTKERTYSTAGSTINGKIVWDATVDGVIFTISWDGSKWVQHISASPGTINTVNTDDTTYPWRNAGGELKSNFSNLIHYSNRVSGFSDLEPIANQQINNFFRAGGFIKTPFINQDQESFDVSSIFPKEDVSDRSFDFSVSVFSNYAESGSASEYYDYLVNTLSNGISQNNSFVNLELAKKIKNAGYMTFQDAAGIEVPRFGSTNLNDDYFIIGQNYQLNSGSGVAPSKFISGFVEEFTPSLNGVSGKNVSENHLKYIFFSEEFKKTITKTIDFTSGSGTFEQPFVLTPALNEDPFSSSSTNIIAPGISTTTNTVSTDIDINLQRFNDDRLNQKYSVDGVANSKFYYASEDQNFNILYGATGLKSPIISSVTGSGIGSGLASNSGEYVVTISGVYSGLSYDIEFNDIEMSAYNVSGFIQRIETDFQSLPVSNSLTITPLNPTGSNKDMISFKLVESGNTGINNPSSIDSFSTGDINFIRDNKFTPLDFDTNTGTDLNWLVRSGTFGSRQDLLFYTGNILNNNILSPNGLIDDWFNLTGNFQENPSIFNESFNSSFLTSSGISGGFLLFTFDGLISGKTYYEEMPTGVQFPGDTTLYSVSGQQEFNNYGGDPAFFKNAISFTARSFTHTAQVAYALLGSGHVKLENDNFLLQENGGRFTREIINSSTELVTNVTAGSPVDLRTFTGIVSGNDLISGLTGVSGLSDEGGLTNRFVHGLPFTYESEEFSIFIPEGTTVS